MSQRNDIQTRIIIQALKIAEGSVRKAAKELGISYRTLYRWIKDEKELSEWNESTANVVESNYSAVPTQRPFHQTNVNLTEKQKLFCAHYIRDWNGTRAYMVAYPKVKETTARVNASKLLSNTNILSYIDHIKQDVEKLAGISLLKIVQEHQKIAFSSIGYLHDTWITRKEFEALTDEQRACIQQIDTKVERKVRDEQDYEVEHIKVKLYDKTRALVEISKLLGYYAPEKIEHKLEPPPITGIRITVDGAS